jgi:hypothetical protein
MRLGITCNSKFWSVDTLLVTDELGQGLAPSRAETLARCYSRAFSPSFRSGDRGSRKSGVSSVRCAQREARGGSLARANARALRDGPELEAAGSQGHGAGASAFPRARPAVPSQPAIGKLTDRLAKESGSGGRLPRLGWWPGTAASAPVLGFARCGSVLTGSAAPGPRSGSAARLRPVRAAPRTRRSLRRNTCGKRTAAPGKAQNRGRAPQHRNWMK